MRESSGRAATPLLGIFRMPIDGSIADNFQRGGVGSPVALASGELGPAVRKDVALTHIDLMTHPNTGARIQGRTLPGWDSVVGLALEAHQAFSQFPSVGWDIAITPEGPILVEGNYNWGVGVSQQVGSRPLGATPFPGHVLQWLQESARR